MPAGVQKKEKKNDNVNNMSLFLQLQASHGLSNSYMKLLLLFVSKLLVENFILENNFAH